MSHKSSQAMFLRFPPVLRRWVAEEALHGRRSMNAVIVQAVDFLKAKRTEQRAHDNHAAAIERAISLARLPEGTAFLYQPGSHDQETGVFILKPKQAEYSFLARVNGEQVVFAGDPGATFAEAGA
jgi:hypothetical protein